MQKRVDDILYIFDMTAYEIIEDTDVDVIYVQYERLEEYKELNESLAEKIEGFNQFTMTVQPKPWVGEEPEPEPEPEPESDPEKV